MFSFSSSTFMQEVLQEHLFPKNKYCVAAASE